VKIHDFNERLKDAILIADGAMVPCCTKRLAHNAASTR